MNKQLVDNFVYKYGAKVSGTSALPFSTVNTFNGSYSYPTSSRRTVTIELDSHFFQQLVSASDHADEEYRVSRGDQHIRDNNPTVAKAYDQYKMLLELHR